MMNSADPLVSNWIIKMQTIFTTPTTFTINSYCGEDMITPHLLMIFSPFGFFLGKF